MVSVACGESDSAWLVAIPWYGATSDAHLPSPKRTTLLPPTYVGSAFGTVSSLAIQRESRAPARATPRRWHRRDPQPSRTCRFRPCLEATIALASGRHEIHVEVCNQRRGSLLVRHDSSWSLHSSCVCSPIATPWHSLVTLFARASVTNPIHKRFPARRRRDRARRSRRCAVA